MFDCGCDKCLEVVVGLCYVLRGKQEQARWWKESLYTFEVGVHLAKHS